MLLKLFLVWLCLISRLNGNQTIMVKATTQLTTTPIPILQPISYNQPKLSPCATWNPNATTFANSTQIGSNPRNIFVTTNNTVYIAATSLYMIRVWTEGSRTPTRNISSDMGATYSVFVTANEDVYVDNGALRYQIDKWTSNSQSSIVMTVIDKCVYLFIDIADTLYCSHDSKNQVVKGALSNGSATATIAAGNGTAGSDQYTLSSPNGIFVDRKLNLFVADYQNNRIQLFLSGQRRGTTVAGAGATGTIVLNNPSGVSLDSDGYLFIADRSGNRIVGSGPNGFRCLVGCSGVSGSAANQLNEPLTVVFDTYGNIFVVDQVNSRVQKFLLATNSCGEYTYGLLKLR